MKRLIKKAINKVGFDIVRLTPERSSAFRMRRLLCYHEIDLILDVGANVGQYARLVRLLGYSGRIVSFEPLSSAYRQLLEAKGTDTRWIIAPRTAIGDSDGDIRINIAGNSYSSSILDMLDAHREAAPDSSYVGWEMVRISRLDTIADQYIESSTRNIFLKIDVQGFEKQVLEGAKRILPRVKGIQLEISLVPLYQGQTLLRGTLDIMDGLGFDLYDISPVFSDLQTGRLLQADGIFLKRDFVRNNTGSLRCD